MMGGDWWNPEPPPMQPVPAALVYWFLVHVHREPVIAGNQLLFSGRTEPGISMAYTVPGQLSILQAFTGDVIAPKWAAQ